MLQSQLKFLRPSTSKIVRYYARTFNKELARTDENESAAVASRTRTAAVEGSSETKPKVVDRLAKRRRRRHPQLDKFFEDPDQWGVPEIKVGRSWTKDDLRLKSNSDLHKLWFVLLIERNKLMTMEAEAKRTYETVVNPERKFRVQESMDALEDVVHERNVAVLELERGEMTERPRKYVTSDVGLSYWRDMDENLVPYGENELYKYREYEQPVWDETTMKFRAYMRENEWDKKRNQEDDRRKAEKLHKKVYKHVDDMPYDDDFFF